MYTLGEIIGRLCADFGATLNESSLPIVTGRGEMRVRYLVRRDDNGAGRTLVLPLVANSQTCIATSVLRSWCVQLAINPIEFDIFD